MLILCKCKNIFWGERLRGGGGGVAPGSDVVIIAHHVGEVGGMPPRNFFKILMSLRWILAQFSE